MREKILQKVLSVIFFIAILIGCQKDYFDPEYFEKNYIIQNIPKNFDWSNISTLDVTVIPYDTHNNKYFYTIEIFDENPVFEKEKAILLAKGVGSQNQTFQTSVVLPKGTPTIFVRQTSPEGQQTIQEYTVEGNKLTCNFNPVPNTNVLAKTAPKINTIQNYNIEQTDFPTPSQAIEINSSSPSPYRLQYGNSYVIRGNYTGEIEYSWGNVSLYVEGTWQNTSSARLKLEKDDNLIIQNGGEIIFNEPVDIQATSDETNIVVAPGGKFNLAQKEVNLTLSNKSKFIVRGKVFLKNLIFENGARLYNTGETSVTNFTVKNNQTMVTNDGSLVADEVNLIGSLFTNNGPLTTDNFITEGSTFINNSKFTAKYIDFKRGAYTNNCMTLYDDFTMNGTTLSLAANTLVSGTSMTVKGTTIQMEGHSIISISDKMSFTNASSTINGIGNEEFALLRVKEIDAKSWKIATFRGNLEIECSHYPGANYHVLLEPAHWVAEGESTIRIPASECTDGNITDPGDPKDPDFPIEGDSTLMYTWITEDMFPDLGDYDMNDLVVDLGAIPAINSNNMAESLTLKIVIRAVGSTRTIGAALQLDQVIPGEIQSVTYSVNNLFEGKMFSVNAKGLENDQTQAVVPLFENAHKIMGVYNTAIMINTFALGSVVPGKGERKDIQKFEVKIEFSRPIALNKINMNRLNLFVISGNKFTPRRTEIHLPGFKHTALSNISRPIEESTDGLMWGLLVPRSFRYPAEAISILKAYPDFEKWVTSGGTNYLEWYKSPSTNDAYIYR
ncbi:LruC domain-containing protein [Gabonibacter chumensis]|uniref:LruC domain-containing protein n=1 Tax=Gabonibacter chumensis TaxID=2972474 RepID=UPI002572E730|nr:LruC domain-containing protein [Gabonibacter chumensis]MCR9013037.1 LruC domain-containing protein [Gabonibacter chumensis]